MKDSAEVVDRMMSKAFIPQKSQLLEMCIITVDGVVEFKIFKKIGLGCLLFFMT